MSERLYPGQCWWLCDPRQAWAQARRVLAHLEQHLSDTQTPAWMTLAHHVAHGVWFQGRWVGMAVDWAATRPLNPRHLAIAGLKKPTWVLDMPPDILNRPAVARLSAGVDRFRFEHIQALSPHADDPAPPWIEAALDLRLADLQAELACVKWDAASVERWWSLMEGLALSPTIQEVPRDRLHIVTRAAGAEWPREGPFAAAWGHLARALPAAHRRPAVLAKWLRTSPPSRGPARREAVINALRAWVSPTQLWRRAYDLQFAVHFETAFGSQEHIPMAEDFQRLPRRAAEAALTRAWGPSRKQLEHSQILHPLNLPLLPLYLEHAPGWAGWGEALEILLGRSQSPPETLRAEWARRKGGRLEAGLPQTEAAAPRARPRM